MQKSTIILSFIVGVLVTILSYQIYINYQFQKLYLEDHKALVEVVSFINENIIKNKDVAPTK